MARGPWQAEYFDGTNLAGTPLLVREEAEIDFAWRFGSPDPAVPVERFSARWTATLDFPAGRYQFSTHTDDGVRLLVDGRLIIENWWPMRGYQYATVDLPAGPHTLVMEYYERTEAALAGLSWIWLGDSLGAATPI
jgi:chitinase